MAVESEMGRELQQGLGALLTRFQEMGPGVPVYVYGSMARRWSMMAAESGSWQMKLTSYLEMASEDLHPNMTRGKMDVDIAVPADRMSWNQVAQIAKEESARFEKLIIDPHLIKMEGARARVSTEHEALPRQYLLDTTFNILDVGEGKTLFPFDVITLLAYYRIYGALGPKHEREKNKLIDFLRHNRLADESADRITALPVRTKDVIRLGYRTLVPRNLRMMIRNKRFGEGADGAGRKFNYESPVPMYV